MLHSQRLLRELLDNVLSLLAVLTNNPQRATYNGSQEHTPRRQEHAATPLPEGILDQKRKSVRTRPSTSVQEHGPVLGKSRRAVPARCAQVPRSDASRPGSWLRPEEQEIKREEEKRRESRFYQTLDPKPHTRRLSPSLLISCSR